ncbi:MAG: hypothetical protein ACM3SY_02745 [Candidatus Omnitrophota bacterium]
MNNEQKHVDEHLIQQGEETVPEIKEGETMSKTVLQQLREEGFELGIKEGKELGVKEGIKEGEEVAKMKIVFNCLLKGMDVETISEITGLSVAQIEIMKNLFPREKRP